MTTTVAEDINGKAVAATIRAEIRNEVTRLQASNDTTPGLAVILVGSRRDSQTYVNMKKKACAEAGVQSFGFDYEDDVTQEVLSAKVDDLNKDPRVHGILIQLPLPKHLDQEQLLDSVDPDKDVDGLHPVNVARLTMMDNSLSLHELTFSVPCTPLGCMELLERSNVEIKGKHAVVLGRSNLVGLPMARLLLGRDATVTTVHSKTTNIREVVRQADIVVAAIGRARMVDKEWLKKGAVVIDVGINSVDIEPTKPGGKPYKLVGDVDYDSAREICSRITPVPGGVGPMTIAMLLRNTLNACKRSLVQKE